MKKIFISFLFATSAMAVNVNDPWSPGPSGLQLGSATSGNFVGTVAAGNGIATTGAATGENINHSISVNQDYDFTMTGNFSFTPAGTDDFTLTTDAGSNLIIVGLTDVSGDALCISSGNVAGTCAAAVFTTSVSSPAIISPLSGGADDITFSPAGTLGMTLAETTGNLTVVGDVIASGGDITTLDVQSAATGGADDVTISPAGTAKFTVAEAGQVQINGVVSSHSACEAAGDRGRMEFYDNGADKVSLCACVQTAAATYSWAVASAGGAC